MEQIREAILANPDLARLSPDTVRALAEAAREVHFEPGDRLTTEMVPSRRVWLLLKGEVEGGIDLANRSQPTERSAIGPGELVGLIHFADPSSSLLSLHAVTEVHALAWDVEVLQRISEASPRDGYLMAMACARHLVRRMAQGNANVLDELAWGLE